MLVGEGANKFARQMGVPEVNEEDLIVEKRRKALEAHPAFKRRVQSLEKDRYEILHQNDNSTLVP